MSEHQQTQRMCSRCIDSHGWSLTGVQLSGCIIQFNCYADDLQISLSLKPDCSNALHSVLDCIAAAKQWLGQKSLFLNKQKTEYILFGGSATTDASALMFNLKKSFNI
ncbi:hypothetical protein ATANTOWER_006600 [Ataeniobius toweri]|uniref:Reverse transcriptase domain-containing protein n=1 Tax=Ataeniobius toweri TaxID=208326 RepID=A0ABU7AP31_9TELE|nr:hypothetical protein [Ataeniobius toweri]